MKPGTALLFDLHLIFLPHKSYAEVEPLFTLLCFLLQRLTQVWCLTTSYSMFPKSTHETFAQKLYQTFKNNKRFIKPKLSRTSFTISHYAGEVNIIVVNLVHKVFNFEECKGIHDFFPQVTYLADQFLDKNKDYVVAEHQDLLTASSCSFVAGLFPRVAEETSKSSKFSSIGSRFKVL